MFLLSKRICLLEKFCGPFLGGVLLAGAALLVLMPGKVLGAEGDKLKLNPMITTWVGDQETYQPLSSLNAAAAAYNMSQFPNRISITDNNTWILQSLSRQLSRFNLRAGTEHELTYINELMTNLAQSQVCYEGSVKGVIDILLTSFDQLSEKIGVYGAKANGETTIPGEVEFFQPGTEQYEGLWYGDHVRIRNEWERYPATETTMLVLSSYGQQGDGTELEVFRIPKCQ